MLRRLLLLVVIAGLSASIPVVYQVHPETFHKLLSRAVERPVEADGEPRMQALVTRPRDTLSGRKVRVDADERGHFLANFKLNGRTVEAMVDTGATLVAINASTARRIGIRLQGSDFSHRVDTANGSPRAATAMIDSLQIGRIHVENVQAVVLEDKALRNTLVGMSFLNRLDKYQVESGSLLLVQ